MSARLLLILALVSVTAACNRAHMRVAGPLQAGKVAVTDHGGWFETGPLTVGEFQATHLDRGWTHSSGFSFIGSSSKAKQRYRFDLVQAGVVTPVACVTRLQARDIDFGLVNYHEGQQRLDCGTAAQATMTLSAADESHFVGFLTAPDGTLIEVRSAHRVVESPWEVGLVGFEFFYNGRPVAALQTMNDFHLWIDPTLPPAWRGAVILHAAALMFFEPLKSDS